MLAPKHAAMLETLKGASEQDFQALYIEMQTVAHMEAVTLFATYAKGGDDAAVKAFAAETLPTLAMHKMHVMKLVAAH
jgi:putative membrane protein